MSGEPRPPRRRAYSSPSVETSFPSPWGPTVTTSTRPAALPTIPLDLIFNYPTIADDQGHMGLLQQITNTFGPGAGFNMPDQSALLMDGTKYMMLRSQSTTCMTELPVPLPSAIPSPPTDDADAGGRQGVKFDDLSLQRCRQCANEYVVQLQSGTDRSVTVIAGVPKADGTPYKAMSYVWGSLPESPLSIPCLQCGHITRVPMASAQRFHNLMELGGQGNTIWLDALSIDQFNSRDVSAHVAIMGKIYKGAKCVSVLLPASDQAAYELLKEIERHAKTILLHRQYFIENVDLTTEDPGSGKPVKVLTTVCQLFLAGLRRLREHLHQFVYWSRAWTFQEWALAANLEVAMEGGTKGETCFNLKSLVLGAAMLISRYKILQHQYVDIKLGEGITRGDIPPLFNSIKALFPDEDLFLSYEEIDAKEVSLQAQFPHFGVNHLLGVRSVPPPKTGLESPSFDIASATRPDHLSRIRARLILLLSAFASSKREATHEADLVACWASMCNIAYTYDRTDDFPTALKKAVKALRAQGVVIYDFLPDTKGGISTPTEIFCAYAREHRQLNATNEAEFPGAPIFTGRADTVSHLIYSLEKVSLPTEWNDCAEEDDQSLGMRVVLASMVEEYIALDGDLGAAMTAFEEEAIYGELPPGFEQFMFWTVKSVATARLKKVPAEQRAKARLVIARICFGKHDSQSPSLLRGFSTWAIVPTDVVLEEVVVCREPTNGTLTLAVKREGRYRIVAYLTLSDNLSGTFLVNTDEVGRINLTLRIPERGDVRISTHNQIAVRELRGEVWLKH